MIDSQEVDREALNYVLALYEKPPWSETRKTRDPDKSIKENFPIFFGKYAEDAYKEYINYLLSYSDRMPLFEGALDTLKELNKKGVHTIIISNRDQSFVDATLERLRLEKYVSLAIGAGTTPYSKPSKELVDVALSKLQIKDSVDQIIFVGDAIADIKCADECNALPILMRMCKTDVTDEWLAKRFQENKPLSVARNHRELQSILNGISTAKNDNQPKRFLSLLSKRFNS